MTVCVLVCACVCVCVRADAVTGMGSPLYTELLAGVLALKGL